jgi:hypothetical protein
MWLGRDFGWWGFVFGATALVLAVPLTIIGNVLTPKLLNWWASRSIISTQKRITSLERQLSKYEIFYKELSDTEDWILKGIEALGMLGSLILMFTSLGILALGTVYKPSQSWLWRFSVPFEYMSLLGMIFTTFFVYGIFLKLSKYRKRRSPEVRRILKLSIEKLKSNSTPSAEEK